MAKYKRVLIKLSGEALGENGRLFDFEQIDRVAAIIGELHKTGTEIAIVIGAGNIWRGRQGPAAKMTPINADHMGMLGTAINSIAMQDAIERLSIPTRVMSAVEIGADAILLAKNVDGVYDSDPRVNPEAKLLKDLTYHEVQERDLKVMDAAAITICRENKVPSIRVFGLDDPQNILRVIEGDPMGTNVHP